MTRPGLNRGGSYSTTPGLLPLCDSCGHSRASHGQRSTRCWAIGCTCPTGYVLPEVKG